MKRIAGIETSPDLKDSLIGDGDGSLEMEAREP